MGEYGPNLGIMFSQDPYVGDSIFVNFYCQRLSCDICLEAGTIMSVTALTVLKSIPFSINSSDRFDCKFSLRARHVMARVTFVSVLMIFYITEAGDFNYSTLCLARGVTSPALVQPILVCGHWSCWCIPYSFYVKVYIMMSLVNTAHTIVLFTNLPRYWRLITLKFVACEPFSANQVPQSTPVEIVS